MEDYNEFEYVSYDDFKVKHLELLQRPKRVLVSDAKWSEEHFDFYKIHSLYMSGYISKDRYTEALREETEDIDPVIFYEVINNKHRQMIKGESILHLRLNRDELIEVLNNNLKNNCFTILLFMTENYNEDEMACLVLKNKGELQFIEYGEEEPFISTLDEFLIRNELIEDEIYLFCIEGRHEGKKRAQKTILELVSKTRLPSDLSKDVFDYFNPHHEYSPKRKSNDGFGCKEVKCGSKISKEDTKIIKNKQYYK